MAGTIRLKDDTSLKYQPNLGEEVEEVDFPAGTEFAVLQEWDTAWLVKDDDGHLFNVKKSLAEES